jgi:hypothetical protein
LENAAYSAIGEHLQKPHNAGARREARFFNTLLECCHFRTDINYRHVIETTSGFSFCADTVETPHFFRAHFKAFLFLIKMLSCMIFFSGSAGTFFAFFSAINVLLNLRLLDNDKPPERVGRNATGLRRTQAGCRSFPIQSKCFYNVSKSSTRWLESKAYTRVLT